MAGIGTRSAIFLLASLLSCPVAAEAGAGGDKQLWQAPNTDSILVEPAVGYSEGADISGATLSLSGMFAFRYFMTGLHGQVIFSASGAVYDISLDLNLRYGPVYLGVSAVGHWFPGDSREMKPGVAGSLGVYIPLPFDGIFFDISYRPVFVFLKSRNMLFHFISCGVVFEFGS